METTRIEAPVLVDCPWCGRDAEVHPASGTLTCDTCRIEVALAADPARIGLAAA